MRTLIIMMAVLPSLAFAQVSDIDYYVDAKGKKMIKVEALIKLAKSEGKAEIWRCRQQVLSRKGTIKNK